MASVGDAAEEIAYRQRRAALRQTFFGIPDHSERIVFAIDASDSMLEPLTPDGLDALRPITVADALGSPGDEAGGAEEGRPMVVGCRERAGPSWWP